MGLKIYATFCYNGLMLCKTCRHCGLCPGDFTVPSKIISESSSFSQIPPVKADASEIGVAVDIGTTTLAFATYALCSGKLILEYGEENQQIKFGTDVVSRISYGQTEAGLERMHRTITSQIENNLMRILLAVSSMKEYRGKRPVISKIVVAGNTAMESIFLGLSLSGLSQFPFEVPSQLGGSYSSSEIFSGNLPQCQLYVVPPIAPFVGGDTVAAILSSFSETGSQLVADLGTNCEIAFFNSATGRITATSCAAGPAFEAQGMDCGMAAGNGAVVTSDFSDGTASSVKTLGNVEPKGICGSGYFSIIRKAVQNGIVSTDGEIRTPGGKIYLTDKVFVSQKDVRNFQMALGALRTGISYLTENINMEEISSVHIAGGFGKALDMEDVKFFKLVPGAWGSLLSAVGNASLKGASMLLTSVKAHERVVKILNGASVFDMAQKSDFQERYLSSFDL